MKEILYKRDHAIAFALEDNMVTECFGKRVYYYEEVDSTNNIGKQLGKEPGSHGILVVAGQQNAGKGRLGRSWASPKGSGIFMSLVLQPMIQPANASMLTLVTALAVNEGIRKNTGLNSLIKWPNDITVNGKKICGILTEMSSNQDRLESIVIGIGINVSQEMFPEAIEKTATSLLRECGQRIANSKLIVDIMELLESYYKEFIKTESLRDIYEEYNNQLVNLDRPVKIIESDTEYTGVSRGINQTGALLVEIEEEKDGKKVSVVKTVVSGEVSVRGIYGYV